MKVGILVCDSSVRDELVYGLKSAGINVEVHVTHASDAPAVSLLQAGNFINKAACYDIIHNFSGGIGLLYAHMAGKLMVSSVSEKPSNEDLAIFRAAGETCFFVSELGLVESFGLKGVPGIDTFAGDRVRFYLDVYTRIIALGKKKEHRPWGNYEVLSAEKDDHKVKRITVLPGKRLSLQYHGKRREHWIVISGQALVTVGEEKVRLDPTGAIDIPHETAHRIENVGTQDLVFIEVQQGNYFGEDDIVRIEDDFGRI